MNSERKALQVNWRHFAAGAILESSLGATRFRRKLSRPEGMPGATCPLSGGKLQLPIRSWLSLLN
jgi:hypothetical protein